MFIFLTSLLLHDISSFLAGVPPKHTETTLVKTPHFSTSCCFPYSTSLHPDTLRAGGKGGRLVSHFILIFQVYTVVYVSNYRPRKVTSTLALVATWEDVHCIHSSFHFSPRRNLGNHCVWKLVFL